MPFPALALAAALAVPCAPAAPRDLAADTAEMARAVAPVVAAHDARMKALDQGAAGETFLSLQRRYHQDRFTALKPLAERGNVSAIFALARQYQSADAGFADPVQWTRLMHCAAALGEPGAQLELMMETWHDKGDGSFATIQRNRAKTLDLVEQAAARGEVGGLSMLATYIRGGYHQYSIDPDLGRRLAVLCLRASGNGCREELLSSLPDPVDNYALLADLARTQPVRFAARRDAAWAKLTPEQQARTEAAAAALRRVPWTELAPEWAAVRARIVAQGSPASVSCLRGHLCPSV
ncbi:hypothetical protein [Caulobacter segnis]